MKKRIFSIIVYFLILFSVFIPNVYAKNKINIESVTLIEKSDKVIELENPTVDNMNIGFNLNFVEINDYVKYKVIISNDSNKDYYIDNENKFSGSDYVEYIYDYENYDSKIKPNSKLEMYITIKYIKAIPMDKLVNGIYKESNNMSIDLTDVIITNPETYSNMLVIIFIFISLVYSIVRVCKHKKIRLSIIVIPILLPLTIHAIEKLTIRIETNIIIEKNRNIIESRYETGSSNDRDFWQYSSYVKTITFETAIEEPSNYAYKFDVSQEKNNNIIAYLVENADDASYYDLYIMSDGYIYANPNSSYVFAWFMRVTKINNIENYKTYYATNMKNMFSYMYSIEELDLSSFDTSKVTDMSYMFSNMLGSTGNSILRYLNLSNFDTSNVTNMKNMFQCQNFLGELNLSHFNTSKVTDMSNMFSHCSNLTSLDLSSFNTSNVADISNMFYDCNNLTSLDLSNFDTSNVLQMVCVFYYCENLTSLDLSNFDTSKVTDMSSMFYGCHVLAELDLSSFDTANVTSMRYMFCGCEKLINLDISSFDTSNVIDMRSMFSDDFNLETIYVSNNWNVDKVISGSGFTSYSRYMFYNCNKLPNFNSSIIDKTNANTGPRGYLTLKN